MYSLLPFRNHQSSNEAESRIIALATKWKIRAAARQASHKWVADTILRSQDSIEIELAADGVCDASIEYQSDME